MKQYDKIWVPSEDPTDFEVCRIKTGNPLKGWVDVEEDVVVLTIEELGAIWQAAEDRQTWFNSKYRKTTDSACPPTFTEYLQSKGINSLTP